MERIDGASALHIVESAINRCQKMQPKFAAGASQCSLLRNRIKALMIVQDLMSGGHAEVYSLVELETALPPIASILHKTGKAQGKYAQDSRQFLRFELTIQAMQLAHTLLLNEIAQRKTV